MFKKADAQESIAGRDEVRSGPPFLKLESGQNGKAKRIWMRVLPPREDHPNNKFYMWNKVHYGVGGTKAQFKCAAVDSQFCPICVEVDKLRKAGDDRAAGDLAARWVALVNVIEMDEDGKPDMDAGVKVWTPGRKTFGKLLEAIEELSEADQDITDPDTGRWVRVTRRGAKMNEVEYEFSVAEDASDLPRDFVEYLASDDQALHRLNAVYRDGGQNAQALLAGPRQDPFADDDEVVNAEFRDIPEPKPIAKDEDEDEPAPRAAKPRAAKPRDEGEEDEAKQRLRAAIAVDDDDDEDDD